MKRFFNIFAIALVSVLMFSCQKDADVDNFGLGGTVNGKFQLVIPSNELVEITRATEAEESEVKNVTLFYFDAEGNALKSTELGNKNYEQIVLGNAQTSGNYTRTYTIGTKAKFEKEQVVTVYAIANTDSNLGSVDDFTEVANNHTEFTKLLMSMSSLNESFSTMVMSGSVQATVWNTGLIGTIQVKRPYAKVNFTIKNGNSNFTFTPTQYNVKNVPTSGAVFEGGVASDVEFTNYDGMADFVENQGAQVIEFYMLENKAGKAEGVANYNDRELRKDVDNSGKHDEFAHGLANATYVEILGEGKGTNKDGKPILATVTYTIHLGDFTADATDFNVNRNTFYNYTVTVNGVENVVVEANSTAMDDEQFQHGAEGTVINLEGSKMVYTLDAHYEQVLLDINPKSILVNGAINPNTPVLFVSTPFMKETAMITWNDLNNLSEEEFDSKYDTKWVEFWAGENKAGQSTLCDYPGANKAMSAAKFLNFIKDEALKGTESIKVVAFINEYFYDDDPLTGEENIHWSKFVNKEDRVMRILQAPQISADGHSISTMALCSFTQRSIRTVFNTKAGGRPFGIETFDEIGAIGEYSSLTEYASAITESKHGYGSDGQPNGNTYNALAAQDAADACQQRNRAGSNNVWKLATPSQYTAIWLGEQALPNEAKLYKGNPADNLTTAPGWNASYNGVYQHWTSGDDDNRIFWHVEGAAFSPRSWSDASAHFARCVRDLNGETVATPNAEWNNDKRMIIVTNFTESAYRGIATQNLPVHHERDAANKVTKAFVVASNNLSATWKAMNDAPAVPDIVSVSKAGNSLTIWFANKDTYVYAKSATTTDIEQFTNVVLGDGNSVVINSPSGTYYFRTRRNYNTLSQYVTVNADGTYSNTAGGEATAAYSINAGSTNNNRSNIPMMAAMNQDLCAQYTAEDANGTAWRVPNQKELLLMRELDKKSDIGLPNPGEGGFLGFGANPWFLTSTMFSARNLAETGETKRYGFTWYYNYGDGFGLQAYDSTGAVRCVRDASEAELQSLGISNSGDQVDGGDA